MEEVTDEPLYRDRVCGIDIGKAGMAATIRVPSDKDPSRRAEKTRSFGTTKREVLALADWLRCWQVSAVVMEATGDYVRCDGAWVQVGGAAGDRFRPQAQYPGQWCAVRRGWASRRRWSTVDQAAAAAAISHYVGHPSVFPITEPLKQVEKSAAIASHSASLTHPRSHNVG